MVAALLGIMSALAEVSQCPSASLESAGSCCLIKQGRKGSSLSQARGQETKILLAVAHSPMMFKNFVVSW